VREKKKGIHPQQSVTENDHSSVLLPTVNSILKISHYEAHTREFVQVFEWKRLSKMILQLKEMKKLTEASCQEIFVVFEHSILFSL